VHRRRRRARRRGVLLVLTLLIVGGLAVLTTSSGDEPRPTASAGRAAAPDLAPTPGQTALGPLPLSVDLANPSNKVKLRFGRMPRAGLLVNLDTGEVLWHHRADRTVPIASLTKMMTALVVADELKASDKARITPSVLGYSGSGMGVLPRNRRVKVETLLHGLLMVSGNDAARALAFRATGSVRSFVGLMNARAGAMGLRCTRFASIEGLSPKNRSCAADLAVLTRTMLDTPRLARIVRKRKARLPFPIKGGRVELNNSNPLVRQGYPGVLGGKTGYTDPAGRCLVVASRRSGVRLAAIVLRSPDPGGQTRKLLDRGFRAIR
jgi:serine-type D-Ala-D-Ala carboxypeptidase (penicillin-binding protein 5/6)